MKRSVWVTLAGVTGILAGGFILLMAAFMVLGVVMLRGKFPAPAGGPPPGFLFGFMAVIIAVELAFGGACLAGGIGTIRRRPWGRVTLLVIGVLIAIFTLPSAGVILVMPTPGPDLKSDPVAMEVIRFSIAIFYGLWAAMGIWWVALLTRQRARAEFSGGTLPTAAPGPGSERPLSISIIAVLLLFGAACFPLTFVLGSPILLFGRLFHGAAARLLMLGFFAVALYVGIGLWRLNETARKVAIGYSIFGLVNGGVSLLLPGREQLWNEMQHASAESFGLPPSPSLPLAFVYVLAGFTIVAMSVQLYFLITRKTAFEGRAGTPSG